MKIFKSIIPILLLIIANACSEDDTNPTGTLNLKVQADGSTVINTNGRESGRVMGEVVITDFKISIRDVIFKTDLDDTTGVDDSTEVDFRGPYQLDLIKGGDALIATIGTTDIPNGTYKELRFKFHKDESLPSSNPLYDRSIFIGGTIDGTPFEMWHDTSENLDVGSSTWIVVNNNQVNITVSFQIDQFFNSIHQIDISEAVDGNEDGIIEINTNDPDGNKELADLLKENIKAAADILDL